ncbi:Kunitz/Bovine pancreatic trypsin inhibitor domain protein [Ancylostoma ceylanicum]|uniref:Kunitz/Bovine pancreatic trypsin inhibitor domain protein n=1 Tax=Ancylostoma ceylanicum TaxID=53326 RepID=A0A0D6LH20_9BILA|nr:Kunitz/Bovine pancreatic trypsin inhibitor domain protein [Ancylostoma ceylanicum]
MFLEIAGKQDFTSLMSIDHRETAVVIGNMCHLTLNRRTGFAALARFTKMLLTGLVFATIVLLSQQQPRIPDETNQSCGTSLDRGDANCNNPNKTMRWYYDSEMDDCFEYFYEGCGADKGKCGGNMKPTGTCERFDTTCPPGSTCDVGPMGAGICCDDKNEGLDKFCPDGYNCVQGKRLAHCCGPPTP